MKPALLSTILFVTFGTYTLFERGGSVDAIYTAPKTTDGKNIVLFSRSEESLPAPEKIPTTTTVEPIPVSEKPIPARTRTASTPTPEKTVTPTPKPVPTPVKTSTGLYRDGAYTGNSADAYYGYVQVKAIIQGGKITDVQFLDHPSDRGTSIEINNQAMPYLISEAIQAQSANVDTVSGASETSGAFRESLGSALAQARN